MNEKKIFCDECRSDVDFVISKKQLEGAVKGKIYSYSGQEACCENCGLEIYVAEVNDYNLMALYDEYRKENNIISYDKILEIPTKYDIGKRPLSLLLGWGEQTFSRYYDGDIPTKQYSDILQNIYDNPHYYLLMLENNKDNLLNPSAYDKSKKKTNELIDLVACEKLKIYLVVDYILSKDRCVTPLALQKILYYVQGFYYAFYKTFIFDDMCEAWVHGPVYRNVYEKYRDYCYFPIEQNVALPDLTFSSAEIAVMDSVISNFCCYTGKILEIFTHAEDPWLSTRGHLLPNAISDKIIPINVIGEYFDRVKNKYNMINPTDIKSYSLEMLEQN